MIGMIVLARSINAFCIGNNDLPIVAISAACWFFIRLSWPSGVLANISFCLENVLLTTSLIATNFSASVPFLMISFCASVRGIFILVKPATSPLNARPIACDATCASSAVALIPNLPATRFVSASERPSTLSTGTFHLLSS